VEHTCPLGRDGVVECHHARLVEPPGRHLVSIILGWRAAVDAHHHVPWHDAEALGTPERRHSEHGEPLALPPNSPAGNRPTKDEDRAVQNHGGDRNGQGEARLHPCHRSMVAWNPSRR
jgi:hypothetical protein